MLHDLRSHTSQAALPPPRWGEMAWPDKEHPWWSRYQLETILSATTFKQQASKLLRAHTEQLQKSVT